jgi:L-asparaginase II
MSASTRPWAPIFSVERSDRQEVLIEGILTVVSGEANGQIRTVLSIGDDHLPIWTRSLLKPWQLLGHLPVLKEAYPALRPQHLAMMTASHIADVEHLCLLRQMIDIGQISEDSLRCPPSMPISKGLRTKFEWDGEGARPLFHNCSGKHLGYLLAIKAQKIKTDNYLDPGGAQHRPVVSILSQLTGRKAESFVPTIDGCGLPNYSLTTLEMAAMYLGLINYACLPFARIKDPVMAENHPFISELMVQYPNLISGHGTIDTEFMKGRFLKQGVPIKLVAKLAAEGLLAISIGPTERHPHGMSIVIKLAQGMSDRHLEVIYKELLLQLDLADDTAFGASKQDHIKNTFYFRVPE